MFLLTSILLLSAIAAMAQATTGNLRGVVMDTAGAAVAGAGVSVKNEATGAVSQTTTSSEGNYEVPNLPPGTYAVTVEAPNFKRSVSTGVIVRIGIINPLDVKLEAGNVSETVTVTGGTEEIVQREQSQISTTIETRKIQDLPSNGAGGGLDTLALLAPGVIANNSGGVNTNGTGFSVNGNRARSNNFQIDGSDNNDLSVSGPALFIDAQDAVGEVQIITNNFSAQYGRNQGAIVNYVTKGGTNQFHGSLFEFHRDNKNFDSLDNIEKRGGQLKPNQNLYNLFGGQIGGPLYLPRFGEGGKSIISGKDRYFFHFDYQGIRNPFTTTLRTSNLAILGSEFPRLLTSFPGDGLIQAYTRYSTFAIPGAQPRSDLGAGASSLVNPNAPTGCARVIAVGTAPAAGCGTYSGPFLVGGPYDVANINGQLFQAAKAERNDPEPFTETYYDFRFDVKATERNNVWVRYLNQKQVFAHSLTSSPRGFNGDIPATSKNFGGSWTRQISNTMVNEFRANYNKIGVEFGGGCSASTPGCIPGPLEIGSALANITFPAVGVSNRSLVLDTVGPATNLPQGRVGKVYQFADNLTWSRAKHSFIFGAEFKHLTEVSPFLPNYNGAFAFNSTSRIANNAPSTVGITAGDPTLAFKENDQYYFIQDDFKIRPNLTLNLGVRYEYTGQPINLLHDLTVNRESNASSAFFNPALPLSVRTVPFIPPDKNNFAPRVGFAYTPHFWKSIFGEDATVIRGGFSIAYDPAFYNILLNVQNQAPVSAAFSLTGNTLLPNVTNSPFAIPANPTGDVIRAQAVASGATPLGKLDPRYLAQTQVTPDFHSPYSEQFSLGVQHQFGRNQVAEVRYVGTHGVGLFQNVNANFVVGPMYNGIANYFGTGISTPSFRQFIPSGITPQVCTDDPTTLTIREDACNGRILRQASITTRSNSASSIYHSMQARYNGRLLNDSLSLGATYTWSKTIDNASEIFGFDIASPNAQNPFCLGSCERSLSQIDRPHAFSTNFIYDVPYWKEQRGVVGHLLGGWQLNGVYVLTSGEPYTPGQFFNGLLGLGNTYLTSGDRPFVGNPKANPQLVGISEIDAAIFYGTDINNPNGFLSLNALNTTGNAVSVTPNDVRFILNLPGAAKIFNTPFGSATRNSLRGPKLNQLNMGLFKNIKVGERLGVQIRAEAFNVLNHPNPGYGVNGAGYLPDFFTEDAGSTFANNQEIEFARRVVQFGVRITF
jgi:outer membrane receptor protein involved in Fe transport